MFDRDAEVEHLHALVAGQEHVARREIAVHHAALVRVGEGGEHAVEQLQRPTGGKAPRRASRADDLSRLRWNPEILWFNHTNP